MSILLNGILAGRGNTGATPGVPNNPVVIGGVYVVIGGAYVCIGG